MQKNTDFFLKKETMNFNSGSAERPLYKIRSKSEWAGGCTRGEIFDFWNRDALVLIWVDEIIWYLKFQGPKYPHLGYEI